jgi:hypothetical protein
MGNIAHSASGINPHASNHSDGGADEIDVTDLAGLPLPIASGGTGKTTAQAAIDALTAAGTAGNDGKFLGQDTDHSVKLLALPAAPSLLVSSTNLITSWTNISYGTFSTSGANVSSAIGTGGVAKTNSCGFVNNGLYALIVSGYTLSSGYAPAIQICTSASGGLNDLLISEGQLKNGTWLFVTSSTANLLLAYQVSGSGTWSANFRISRIG